MHFHQMGLGIPADLGSIRIKHKCHVVYAAIRRILPGNRPGQPYRVFPGSFCHGLMARFPEYRRFADLGIVIGTVPQFRQQDKLCFLIHGILHPPNVLLYIPCGFQLDQLQLQTALHVTGHRQRRQLCPDTRGPAATGKSRLP